MHCIAILYENIPFNHWTVVKMVQKNNFFPKRMSKMSRFYRILMKIGVIPLCLNECKNEIMFKILSKPMIYYMMYSLICWITYFFCLNMTGFTHLLKFWEEFFIQSNTDSLVILGNFFFLDASIYFSWYSTKMSA